MSVFVGHGDDVYEDGKACTNHSAAFVRAPAAYKRAMAEVFFRKALEVARGRAIVHSAE